MTPSTQAEIDYIAKNLEVKYEVVDNLAEQRVYTAKITLTNTGSEPIKNAGDWKIYFYSIREIQPGMTKNGVRVAGNMFTINYLNGLLYSLTPSNDFVGFKPKDSISITYIASAANVARSDNFPNWYVTAPSIRPKVLESTKGVDAAFVSNFDSPAKWKRSTLDLYEPVKPGQRYERNEMEDQEGAPIAIIPTPKEMHADNEGTTMNIEASKWVVVADSSLQRLAKYLSGTL